MKTATKIVHLIKAYNASDAKCIHCGVSLYAKGKDKMKIKDDVFTRDPKYYEMASVIGYTKCEDVNK